MWFTALYNTLRGFRHGQYRAAVEADCALVDRVRAGRVHPSLPVDIVRRRLRDGCEKSGEQL